MQLLEKAGRPLHHDGAGIAVDAGKWGRAARGVNTNGGMVDHVDKRNIDALARTLAESVPAGIGAVRDDLSKNFAGVLASGLERLDLVTREEFDVQRKVLARTRARLEALEAELEQLEHSRAADPGTGA
jgi:hypothetical protein